MTFVRRALGAAIVCCVLFALLLADGTPRPEHELRSMVLVPLELATLLIFAYLVIVVVAGGIQVWLAEAHPGLSIIALGVYVMLGSMVFGNIPILTLFQYSLTPDTLPSYLISVVAPALLTVEVVLSVWEWRTRAAAP